MKWGRTTSRQGAICRRPTSPDLLAESGRIGPTSLQRWRQELQETASQQAVAEMDLEEERKSLARRESLTTSMERSLERQRESFKTRHEKAAQK